MGNFTEFVFLCHQICDFIRSATLGWVRDQKVPFATYGSAWVGYDDMQSYSHKVKHYDLFFKQCSQPQPPPPPCTELAIKLQNCCCRWSGWQPTTLEVLTFGLWTWMTSVDPSARMDLILSSTTSDCRWVNTLSSF